MATKIPLTLSIIVLLVFRLSCSFEDFPLTFQPFIGDPELDPVCPAAEDIYPCLCYIVDDHLMNIDCPDFVDENEFARAFQSWFPDSIFNKLELNGNKNIKILREGPLNTASFSEIIFNDGIIEEVESQSFSSSFSTAVILSFVSNNIWSFPFEDLSEFSVLTDLYLPDNLIQDFPSIESASLRVLSLAYNPIEVIPSSAFLQLPSLVSIDLDHTDLTLIHPGTFSHLSSLAYLFLGNNRLSHLQDETFSFISTNISVISLSNNIIETLNPMAISGLGEGTAVFLDNNRIEHMDQQRWETLFLTNVHLYLTDNPLICDCGIDWIVRNSTFKSLIQFTSCSDGTDFQQLNIEDFVGC